MMLALRLFFALAATMALLAPAAADPGVVETVRFESHPDRLDFYFTASTPIDGSLAEKIRARKGEVLILRLGGVTAKRRWIKARDRLIKRTLLHPSTQRPPGAVLRVRFEQRVITPELIKQIRAEYVGADRTTVRISVPRPKAKGRTRTPPRPPPTAETPATDETAASDAGDAHPKRGQGAAPKSAANATPEAASAIPAPAEVSAAGVHSPVPAAPHPPRFEAVVSPPAPQTADIVADLDGFVDRLRLGIEQRPGIPRVAVLPLTAMDTASHKAHLDASNTALLGAKLLQQPGLVSVDPAQFREGLERLHRREDGRFALDDARALAAMLGADTLVAGSVLSEGDVVTVSGRAIDIDSGRDLSATRQPFDRDAMRALSEAIRQERTARAAVLESALLPGLGQIGQGHTGRGAGYMTGFLATLGAGIVSVALGATDDGGNGADDHSARSSAFFVAAGAVWLASLVDAIVTSEDQVDYDLSVRPAPR